MSCVESSWRTVISPRQPSRAVELSCASHCWDTTNSAVIYSVTVLRRLLVHTVIASDLKKKWQGYVCIPSKPTSFISFLKKQWSVGLPLKKERKKQKPAWSKMRIKSNILIYGANEMFSGHLERQRFASYSFLSCLLFLRRLFDNYFWLVEFIAVPRRFFTYSFVGS